MSGFWGSNIKLSLFGESHGKGIGIVIDGLPPGFQIDLDDVSLEMRRRAPGRSKLATARKEADVFKILSGYFDAKTTGTPLMILIDNTDIKSRDYEATRYFMRPGHADYTGHIKYDGSNDYRGGGHFSGRLTAPLVFAGAVAKQILSRKNIMIGSHVSSIASVMDDSFNYCDIDLAELNKLRGMELPLRDIEKEDVIRGVILAAKEEGDSVGGTVETAIINIPSGVGSPFFDSLESKIAHLAFSIPAVKGIEFGLGFDLTRLKGSEANDEFYINNEQIKTKTNNNGGINGGITNGMPVIFKTAIKPTPSITAEQNTIDIRDNSEVKLSIEGRHDPCIVPRVIPVIESIAALAVLDLLLEKGDTFVR